MKTDKGFREKAYKLNNKIEILGEYKGAYTKLNVKCKQCNYIWEMSPHNIYKNRGCPICANNTTKTLQQFIEELKVINNQIQVIGEYKNSQTKILCRCLLCNNEWSAKPAHLLSGHGCPNCICSTGERTIKSILEAYNIQFESQKKFDDLIGAKGKKLSFDFYLPEYNTLIEYQGSQHYKPNGYLGGVEKFKYQQNNDNLKRKYAFIKNINLLEISYKDNTKDVLLSYLETVTTTGNI